MKNRKIALMLMAAALWIMSCKSDDSEDPIPVNQAPGAFSVTAEVEDNSVEMSWSVAIDPEGGKVVYDIHLEGEKVAEGIEEANYFLSDLNYERAYSGKIVAKDSVGATVEADFSFTTGFLFLKSYELHGTEYFLEYNESGELINIETLHASSNPLVRNSNNKLIKLGATNLTYNSGGLMNTIDDGSGVGTIQYDSKDRIVRMSSDYDVTPSYKVRVTREHTYNDSGQLIQVDETTYNFSGAYYSYARFKMQYDTKGNIVQMTTQGSSDGETYGDATTYTYTYDDKKNPWYTILSEQAKRDPVHIEAHDLLKNTVSIGNSIVYRTYWMSKNNILSSRIEYGGGHNLKEYTYTYNEDGYPITLQVDVSSSEDDPYTYYQRWYY